MENVRLPLLIIALVAKMIQIIVTTKIQILLNANIVTD